MGTGEGVGEAVEAGVDREREEGGVVFEKEDERERTAKEGDFVGEACEVKRFARTARGPGPARGCTFGDFVGNLGVVGVVGGVGTVGAVELLWVVGVRGVLALGDLGGLRILDV